MSRRDVATQLMHMLDNARWAVRATKGRARTDLDSDPLLRPALERFIAVFGEAAFNLPREFRDDHPQIEWTKIIGTRHRLVHAYQAINPDTIWRVATEKLPEIIPWIESELQSRGVDPDSLLSGDTL